MLSVPRGANDEEIKRAYRNLVLIYHPDKVTDESKKVAAAARFNEVQEAYNLLKDSERRQAYDASL